MINQEQVTKTSFSSGEYFDDRRQQYEQSKNKTIVTKNDKCTQQIVNWKMSENYSYFVNHKCAICSTYQEPIIENPEK